MDSDSIDEEPQPVFPVGYTITFSPPARTRSTRPIDPDEDGVGGATDGAAPRGGPGSQVLPVADYLDADWSGTPDDGAEYLFAVRLEALRRPKVAAVARPRSNRPAITAVSLEGPKRQGYGINPEWVKVSKERFFATRKCFATSLFRSSLPSKYTRVPPPADEKSWRTFIEGDRLDAVAAVQAIGDDAKEPIPGFIAALDQPVIVHLLRHLVIWLQEAESIQASGNVSNTLLHLRWALALLIALSDILIGDDISLLRDLGRLCRSVAEQSKGINSAGRVAALSWSVVVAVCYGWGQLDLLQELRAL